CTKEVGRRAFGQNRFGVW
nr:immunoglobulin heavy chain junction region [Macaca mulatta]MOV43505.1 immunoglobulin heavy chain junction region [Macaca mulatta]MOV44270.1 immunoglobulin heavy chain junction region [Macaca mulatta]MOV46633.1 immunoglobulin heavy chain junction region [Macaca mulatta]